MIRQDVINRSLIPLLCRKANVPTADARGTITSHRARSTIATQLFSARDPMTLLELQAWLGHRTPQATQHYTKITPTRLARAYADAGYFERNVRMVDILVDQEAIRSGAAAKGQPWRYYDLGHGFCTYDFFDQCPHRMACAKCGFYRPKEATVSQLPEATANLLRLKQEIPLSDDERAAVDDGVAALERLKRHLLDTPTPGGPTPRQLGQVPSLHLIPVCTPEALISRSGWETRPPHDSYCAAPPSASVRAWSGCCGGRRRGLRIGGAGAERGGDRNLPGGERGAQRRPGPEC